MEAIRVCFNPDLPDAAYHSDGRALLAAFPKLDLIARRHGWPSPFLFCDPRPVPGGILHWLEHRLAEDLAAETEAESGSWTNWFPSSDGLVMAEGLLGIIRSGTDGTKRLPQRTVVEDQLEQLANCLRLAAERGMRFRFERFTMSGKIVEVARTVADMARDPRIRD